MKLNDSQLSVIEEAIKILDQTVVDRGLGLTNPNMVRDYLRLKLEKEEREIFSVLFLDNQHRIIEYNEMFKGTIDAAAVYVREIIKRGLEINCAALIISHNHPSGESKESLADRNITERIKQAADLVDIRLLDHIIIGSGEMVSFAEKGII